MADTQTAAQTADATQQVTSIAADTTQQVTSTALVTKVKNPKRQAAGKAIAEKTRKAREEQKQKIAEANAIIAKEHLRKAEEEARKAERVVAPPVEATVAPPATPVVESQTLTTTQWLSVASIIVSLAAIYYKREEIKGAIAKVKAPAKAPAPVNVVAPKKSGIRPMD